MKFFCLKLLVSFPNAVRDLFLDTINFYGKTLEIFTKSAGCKVPKLDEFGGL